MPTHNTASDPRTPLFTRPGLFERAATRRHRRLMSVALRENAELRKLCRSAAVLPPNLPDRNHESQ
jgi:hypothetical protein